MFPDKLDMDRCWWHDIKDFEHLSAGQVAQKIYLSGQQQHLSGIFGLLVRTKIDIHGKKKLKMPFFNQKNIYLQYIYMLCDSQCHTYQLGLY